MGKWRYKFILLALCLLAFDASARNTVYIAPHQAQYLVKLHKINDNTARIIDANGTLTYKLSQDCNGWIAHTSIYIDVYFEDGTSKSLISNLSSFESFSGWDYSFAFENYNEEGQEEIYTGNVEFSLKENSATVNFTLPKKQKAIQLPITTLFPVALYKNIIKAANENITFFNAPYYDGSSPTELFKSSIFITSLAGGDEAYNLSGDIDLVKKQPLIKTSIAFFGKTEELVPEFETKFEIFNNGIMKSMVQDLGPIDVDVSLQDIAKLSTPVCEN